MEKYKVNIYLKSGHTLTYLMSEFEVKKNGLNVFSEIKYKLHAEENKIILLIKLEEIVFIDYEEVKE